MSREKVTNKPNDDGPRLRTFAEKFGGPAGLAREIGISPQELNNYLSGRIRIGNKMRARLRSAGCEDTMLLYGVAEIKAPMRNIDEEKMLFMLRQVGVTTPDDLEEMLRVNQQLRMVADKLPKYSAKKKTA